MRRTLLGIAAATLALAACGSSGGGDASPTTAAGAATTEAAAATTAASATATTAASTAATTAAATATTAASTAATTAAASAAGSTVTLDEYTVVTDAVKAGSVSLTVKNDGEFPHELKIVKADSFAALAKSSGGGVDESGLTIVGETARIDGGKTETLTVTLDAGKYVFFCNLGSGGNNHAAKGQHLDVTVG